MENAIPLTPLSPPIDPETITTLETIAQRVLWLSTYMIHYAIVFKKKIFQTSGLSSLG